MIASSTSSNAQFIRNFSSASSNTSTSYIQVTYKLFDWFAEEITLDINFFRQENARRSALSVRSGECYVEILLHHDASQSNEGDQSVSLAKRFLAAYQEAVCVADLAGELASAGKTFEETLSAIADYLDIEADAA
jgi:hypothetical protein